MSKFVAFVVFVFALLSSTAYVVSAEEDDPFPCLQTAALSCIERMAVIEGVNVQDSAELFETLRRENLQELCGLARAYERCVHWDMMRICSQEEHESVYNRYGGVLQQAFATRLFVCIANFSVFNEHKDCLVQTYSELMQAASPCLRDLPSPSETLCLPPGTIGCFSEPATVQCGEEIGNSIAELGSVADSACQAPPDKWRRDLFEFVKNSLRM